MAMPKKVRIVDVGPRDGLQAEPRSVPAEVKVELIHRLADAGIPAVEAGAFVSPKWVPQMADSEAVLNAIERRPGTVYPVLVPNMKGFERAKAANVTEIAVFSAASETFSQKNTNCSIAESLERAAPTARQWLGPIRSSYGLHYVWISALEPARDAQLAEVEKQLRRDLEYAAQAQALQCAIAALRADYDVRGLDVKDLDIETRQVCQ